MSKSFQELGISKEVLKSLESMGYTKPTEIQEKAIPLAIGGKDIVAQAQTGTGKTAAFGIPLVEKVNPKFKRIQALVLVPTRELAIQVAKEVKDLGKNKRVFVFAVYGGKSIKHQIDFLKKGSGVIVVGTPGRVRDLIERGYLRLESVNTLVLDEADRMLEMGFIEDIEFIMSNLPENRQNLLLSATMPREILELAEEFLKPDYETIKVKPDEVTVEKIRQIVYRVSPSKLYETLKEVLSDYVSEKSIVFTQTKLEADEIAEKLQNDGFNASAIHGDFSQNKRESVLRKFRTGELKILVATDVAARGLDIKGVELVVNYKLPKDVESYIHRVGRTGRAGREGTAISVITPEQDKIFMQIQKKINKKLEIINSAPESFSLEKKQERKSHKRSDRRPATGRRR